MPTSITSTPTDISPAVAARANIGPLVRASRPSTTSGGPSGLRAHAPSAAAWRATSSGVRSVPTIPRIPETLIISVSDMGRVRVQRAEGAGRERQEDRRRPARKASTTAGIEMRAGAAPAAPPSARRRCGEAGRPGRSSWRRRHPRPPRSARLEGIRVAIEMIGEAGSVHPLVVRADDGEHGGVLAQKRRQDTLPEDGVLDDALEFLRAERPRLVQDGFRRADLADVVQFAARDGCPPAPVAGEAESGPPSSPHT